MTDDELFPLIQEKLFTSVIGDVMDAAGLCRQFLPPSIRALNPAHVLVGRALPVLEADCVGDAVAHAGEPHPFGLMFRALDDLKPGEVYICTGGSPRYALWGELMSLRAQALGARGAVLDGFHRDTRGIARLGFPVFSAGAYGQDQRVRGRVIDFRCAIAFENGACVRPGDLVVGDVDGVLVVPKAEVEATIEAALAKLAGEGRVHDLIADGVAAQDAFDRTGIM